MDAVHLTMLHTLGNDKNIFILCAYPVFSMNLVSLDGSLSNADMGIRVSDN